MEVAPQCMRRCRSHDHGAAIGAAILRGTEEEAVAYMRWLCANCAHVTDWWGRTALHVAASKGRRQVVEWLIKQRDALLNVRDQESGYTALHRSLFYGQIHVAVSLIQMGANISAFDKEDMTPLDHAMKSRLPIVEFSKYGPSEAYLWGTNANFNLGLGNQQSRNTPELMEHFRRSSINIKQVALHIYHSVFVSDTGRVFSCGHGQGGRLGQDSEQPSLHPQPVKLPAAEVCVQASIGSDHTVLLMESGTVWTCGSNQQHQLGHNPPPKALFAPRRLHPSALPGKVLGVCAGRFHTVLWATEGLRTCGLNAGQLGHPKGEPSFIVPKQVQALALAKSECHITHVASSDAATVVVMKRGTIYVLHEYQCRKIASKMLHVGQVAVSGGRLDSDLEQGSEELRVCVLTTTGKLLFWQQSTQQLTRCMFQLKRLLIVTDVALTNQQLLFATQDGEAFEGFVRPRKKSADALVFPASKGSHEVEWEQVKGSHEEEDWEQVKVRRLPHVHRAVSVSSDPRGRNFAIVQAHPKRALLEVPQLERSDMHTQMLTLLQEASEEDAICDVVFEVCSRRFAAHRCIVGARSETLAQLMAESTTSQDEEPITVKLANLKPEIFEQILQFIYTNQCDLLIPGPCKVKLHHEKKKQDHKIKVKDNEPSYDPKKVSAFQVYELGSRKGSSKRNKTEETSAGVQDPLRGVAASARQLGLQTLSKAFDTVFYSDGKICLRPGHDPYKPPRMSFDREKMQPLCDVSVVSLEGREVQAHRSILAARLEYFHSMFAHGWAEASRSAVLSMALPAPVLEVLLHFLYCDEAPQVFEDAELARAMLVVADQMFIERLKEACECALAAAMTLRNAPELLQFAATYNAPQLKLCCMQYISINLPTFIEARSLDEVEWSVLAELAEYHRELSPVMQRRNLTPFAEEPSSAELESVAASFPVALDQGFDPDERKEVLESKKPKLKKRHRIRRISSGEGPLSRMRKESVSSNASECSEDLEKGVAPLTLDEAEEVPMEEGITLRRMSPPSATPPAEPPMVNSKVAEKKKQWNNMFPDLHTALAAVDLNGTKPTPVDMNGAKPKAGEAKKVVKLSQKQRKRLISEPNTPSTAAPTSPLSPVSPRPAWGMHASSGGKGLQDIMQEEKSQKSIWGPVKSPAQDVGGRQVAMPIPVPTKTQQHYNVSSPQSPPGVAWGLSVSPGLPNLQDIVKDERQQKENLRRVRTKPLQLTQIEDQAIEDLLHFYGAYNSTEERITVKRVETGVVATPTWVNSHR